MVPFSLAYPLDALLAASPWDLLYLTRDARTSPLQLVLRLPRWYRVFIIWNLPLLITAPSFTFRLRYLTLIAHREELVQARYWLLV